MVKTKTLWRVMLWVLTLAWGGTILGMSLQSGPQSTALSSGFTAWFLHLFKAYNALPEAQQLQVLAQAQAVVRELAHVAEYTLFGFFVSSLWRSYRTCRFSLWSFLSAAVFAVVYAAMMWLLGLNSYEKQIFKKMLYKLSRVK